jgi:phosphocarrier protein FPr/phosphocarrier protein
MVGDGVSMDPTSAEVLAPLSGVVTQLHESHHALTITGDGVDVLIHVGIDTVLLRGAGFTPRVAKGDTVLVGQPVLSFDADLVAGKAKSLLTQIVVANMEGVLGLVPASGLVRAGQDVVLTIELAPQAVQAEVSKANAPLAQAEGVLSEPVAIPNPVGMHARPAAILAAQAKTYNADIRLIRGTDEANAKSIVAILGLSLRKDEAVRIRATGPDAARAMDALSQLLADGCGEKAEDAPAQAAPPAPKAAAPRPASLAEGEFAGVSASPGLAVGRVLQYRQGDIEVLEQGEGLVKELDRLEQALRAARLQVDDLRRHAGRCFLISRTGHANRERTRHNLPSNLPHTRRPHDPYHSTTF